MNFSPNSPRRMESPFLLRTKHQAQGEDAGMAKRIALTQNNNLLRLKTDRPLACSLLRKYSYAVSTFC